MPFNTAVFKELRVRNGKIEEVEYQDPFGRIFVELKKFEYEGMSPFLNGRRESKPQSFRGGFTATRLARRPLSIARIRVRPLLWLSSWLSRPPILAGMDENRTHPGRLNSAPQTVLKTAGLPTTDVHGSTPQLDRAPSDSRIVHLCPPASIKLAVFLAVS
jgi:hypothetical protein